MNKPSGKRSTLLAASTLSTVLFSACSATAPTSGNPSPSEYIPIDLVTESPDLVYIVKRGDLLATIADKLTGSSTNWSIIAESNGITDPRRLTVGQPIVVPGFLLPPIVNGKPSTIPSAIAIRGAEQKSRPTVDDIGPDLADVVVKKADPNRRFVLRPLGESSSDDSLDFDGDEYIRVIGTYFPKVVYASPELDAELLMRVTPGTRLPLEKMVDGWYRVNTEKGIGFIRDEDGKPTSADG